MRDPTLLRFGPCEVHLPQREVRLHGVVQAVPPKAHDLLVLLLQQRHRVVQKRELVSALWQRTSVSDSVLANAVMQARRAIGDTATPPAWIKTIHGIGYRFTGEVFESTAQAVSAAALPARASTAPGPARRRIGVLPCDNRSGDPALDWAQLGLMALVGHALEADLRLSVVPISTMLDAVARLPPGTLALEQAQLALRALGLQHVAQAVLRSQGQSLWLDYQVLAADGPTLSGNLRDTDAVALGERFAQAIDAALFPGRESVLAFESRDAFVNQAFARGVELHNQDQWQSAARLFAVVCDMEPGSTAAQLWLVRALVLSGDAAARAAAEGLLARAVALGDSRLQAAAHDVLGFALQMQAPADADTGLQAHWHCEQALRLTEGHDGEDWAIKIQVRAAIAAQSRGQARCALDMYERAEASCRAIGYTFGLGLIQTNAAVVEVAACNLIGAKQRLEEALLLTRGAGADAAATHALCDLAEVNAALGLIDLAVSQVKEAVLALDRLQSAPAAATIALVVVQVVAERGVTVDVERALHKAARIATDSRPPVRGLLLAAQGWLARCQGDAATALQRLNEALALAATSPSMAECQRACLRLLMRVHVATSDFAAAAQVRQQMSGLPGWATDLELQGHALHAQAAEHVLRGDADSALALLASLIEQIPFSRPQACARLDAAWLHAQRGDVQRAAQLLAGAGAWCKEHPAGLAAEARLRFAQGQTREAAAAQRRAVQMFNAGVPPWHLALLQSYDGAAAPTPLPDLPGLPDLPPLVSESWLPALPQHQSASPFSAACDVSQDGGCEE